MFRQARFLCDESFSHDSLLEEKQTFLQTNKLLNLFVKICVHSCGLAKEGQCFFTCKGLNSSHFLELTLAKITAAFCAM